MLSEMVLLGEELVSDERAAEVAQEFVRSLLQNGLLEDAQEAEDGDENAVAMLRWSRQACLAWYGEELLLQWPVPNDAEGDAELVVEEKSLYEIGLSMVMFLSSVGCVKTERQQLAMEMYLLRVVRYFVDSAFLVHLTPGEDDLTKDMYRRSEVDESRFAADAERIARRLLSPTQVQRALEAKISAPAEPLDLKKRSTTKDNVCSKSKARKRKTSGIILVSLFANGTLAGMMRASFVMYGMTKWALMMCRLFVVSAVATNVRSQWILSVRSRWSLSARACGKYWIKCSGVLPTMSPWT
jgi:hypothetical protein